MYALRTHVANAYKKDIEVRVDRIKQNQIGYERGRESRTAYEGEGAVSGLFEKIGANISGKADFVDNLHQNDTYVLDLTEGFTTVRSGGYLRFDVTGDHGNVYVSVRSRNKTIASHFPLCNKYSLIVDRNGYVRIAKYGKIWMDENGIDHSYYAISAYVQRK